MNSNNNIYTSKCHLCDTELKDSPNALSNHLYHRHTSITKKEYYDEYLKSSTEGECIRCGKEASWVNITKGYTKHCSPSCATKTQWEGNTERKELLSKRLIGNNQGDGRPKGSKNKKPWSKEARLNQSKIFKGRLAPWNNDPQKIEKQKEAWENKSDQEIKDMVTKQNDTFINNLEALPSTYGLDKRKTKMKFYRGKFRPKNIDKYAGDYTKITYRSMWERQVFKYCDDKSHIIKWSSEEDIIPYRCKTDGKQHRYFPDLKVTFNTGDTYLIEIKPKKQTEEPKIRSRKTKKYINEVTTYAKNISKWEAAEKWCSKRGYKFAIWTEIEIRGLGIKLLT